MSDCDSRASMNYHESATIVICTHSEDRFPTLERAVCTARKQMRFDDELLVIVDHNDALFRRCRESLEGCSVLQNSHRPGLSGARNTALEIAGGSVITFLDDDAVPTDGWLDALRAPYSDDTVQGVGGLIVAQWSGGKPRWFPDEFLWVVGCTHRGFPSDAHQVRNLVGANMSFRKSALAATGGFVETMGRIAGRPLGCEETELCIRLTQSNPRAILLYQPAARVHHHISGERGSLRYFARRCWAEGLSKAEVSRRVGSSRALSEERRYVLRVIPIGVWRGLRDAAAGDFQGAARSAAATAGLVLTGAGYAAAAFGHFFIRSPEAS